MRSLKRRLYEVRHISHSAYSKIVDALSDKKNICDSSLEQLKRYAENEFRDAFDIFRTCVRSGIELDMDRHMEFVFPDNPVCIKKIKDLDVKYLLEYRFPRFMLPELPHMVEQFENGELFRFKYLSTKRGKNSVHWDKIINSAFQFNDGNCLAVLAVLQSIIACNLLESDIKQSGIVLHDIWSETITLLDDIDSYF